MLPVVTVCKNCKSMTKDDAELNPEDAARDPTGTLSTPLPPAVLTADPTTDSDENTPWPQNVHLSLGVVIHPLAKLTAPFNAPDLIKDTVLGYAAIHLAAAAVVENSAIPETTALPM